MCGLKTAPVSGLIPGGTGSDAEGSVTGYQGSCWKMLVQGGSGCWLEELVAVSEGTGAAPCDAALCGAAPCGVSPDDTGP